MYSYKFRVGYSQSDDKRFMSFPAIIDVFQDCSCFHSDDLGVGFDYLIPKSLVWVLNYWEVEIVKRPAYGQNLTVGTYPYDFKGFFGYRNFCLTDDTGDYLVKANSLWLLMDWDKMTPAKVTEEMKNAYELSPKLDMSYSPRKIVLPDTTPTAPEAVTIGRHHLDSNGHVNNGQYIKIAMGCIPTRKDYTRLRAEYREQAHIGDVIHPLLYESDDLTVVALNDEEGKSYAVIELKN